MISEYTKNIMIQAVTNPSKYGSGNARRELQATYDKMLSEISDSLFSQPLCNKMTLRQKLNRLPNKSNAVLMILEMMRNESMLFSRDYRDHNTNIELFLTNHVSHFLRAI